MTKRCPGCDRRLVAEAFYDEPNDTVTGLSMLCRECLAKPKRKKRSVRGWWTRSPAGLRGDVLNVREESVEIVVLPMVDSDK
jgi:hypothetical protein